MNGSSAGQNAFHLEDVSAKWGFKLWTLTFDCPGEKVNKLDREVLRELSGLISRLAEMGLGGEIEALVLRSGKSGNFLAGADIKMFQELKNSDQAEELSREGQKLVSRWEDLPFPTVAAINGICLGGGSEWALASSAIVISDDPSAKIGFPEVMLGILPGSGGCVRLPRKVGLATALDLILTGKNLNGDRAFKAGLADGLLPRQNFDEAILHWTRSNLNALKSGRRIAKEPKLGGMGGPVGTIMEKTQVGRRIIFKKARDGVLEKTKGHYPAPLEILDVIFETGGNYGERLKGPARDRAMAREAKGFGKLALTEVSRNLVRIFFLTEATKRSNGLPSGAGAQARDIRSVAVLGAGVMGGGIAQLFADRRVPIRMKDLNTPALESGIKAATRIWQRDVQKRKISQREMLQKLNLITPSVDYSGFKASDLVVEAVIEKMDVKKAVFRELEDQVGDSCVIASNTSSLSISEMQSVLRNPGRFLGMHFFNPVNRMPLVEVIRGKDTSDEAVTTVFQFSKKVGKTPIVVKDVPGFLVNRLLAPYMNEAVFLVEEGVAITDLDEALVDFGMPMGPMELIDEVGVDVAEKVGHILNEAYGARMAAASINAKVVGSGRLGKKNGKGYYLYSGQKKRKEVDPGIYKILEVTPRHGGVTDEEIVDRCVLPMINEASRCLDEGVVESASIVDLGMIMGTGFPPFRGGLLRYADSLGAREIVERLRKYEARFGARFEPAPTLLKWASNGGKFHSD